MKSRVLKAGKILQANNPKVVDLKRLYSNDADCCAKCYHLRFIRVNSKEHFFCKYKDREITHDNTSHCKDFVDSDGVQELLKQITKHSKLFYKLVRKTMLEEQFKKDLELLYNLPYKSD